MVLVEESQLTPAQLSSLVAWLVCLGPSGAETTGAGGSWELVGLTLTVTSRPVDGCLPCTLPTAGDPDAVRAILFAVTSPLSRAGFGSDDKVGLTRLLAGSPIPPDLFVTVERLQAPADDGSGHHHDHHPISLFARAPSFRSWVPDQPDEDPLGLHKIDTVITGRDDGEATAPFIETAPATTAVVVVKSYLTEGKRSKEVGALLQRLLSDEEGSGLYLHGARWVYLERDELSKTDKNLSFATTEYLQHAKPRALLVLALRGSEATSRVEAILGPRDPILAKRTDPTSVSAMLGVDRERNVAFLVPSASGSPHASSTKELMFSFGGR